MQPERPDGPVPELHSRLEAWFAGLRTELARARGEERDPEIVHQVRVLIRRLRSAFKIVTGCERSEPVRPSGTKQELRRSRTTEGAPRVKGSRALARVLKRIASEAGSVRDADVLEEYLAELKDVPEASAPGWPEAIGLLQDELSAARDAGRRALQELLAQEEVAAQLARGPEVLARLAGIAPAPIELAPVIVGRLSELGEHVARARVANDPEEWHQVRIAIKRVRYATELVSGKESPLIDGLARMQGVLGKAHDHRVWQERARHLRKRLPHRGLDVLARIGLAGIADREGVTAAEHERRFSTECDAAVGSGLRAQLLSSFGLVDLSGELGAKALTPDDAAGPSQGSDA